MVYNKPALDVYNSRFRLLASALPFDPPTTNWRITYKVELISGTVALNDFKMLVNQPASTTTRPLP